MGEIETVRHDNQQEDEKFGDKKSLLESQSVRRFINDDSDANEARTPEEVATDDRNGTTTTLKFARDQSAYDESSWNPTLKTIEEAHLLNNLERNLD